MLKIDGQFARGLPPRRRHGHRRLDHLTRTRPLNLSTTAEGVETTGQRDRLTALGCGYAQDYGSDDPARPTP